MAADISERKKTEILKCCSLTGHQFYETVDLITRV